jgi:hypothetical protein
MAMAMSHLLHAKTSCTNHFDKSLLGKVECYHVQKLEKSWSLWRSARWLVDGAVGLDHVVMRGEDVASVWWCLCHPKLSV